MNPESDEKNDSSDSNSQRSKSKKRKKRKRDKSIEKNRINENDSEDEKEVKTKKKIKPKKRHEEESKKDKEEQIKENIKKYENKIKEKKKRYEELSDSDSEIEFIEEKINEYNKKKKELEKELEKINKIKKNQMRPKSRQDEEPAPITPNLENPKNKENYIVENDERKIEGLMKRQVIIKDNKKPFKELTPKNETHKFISEENSDNIESENYIKKIVYNFPEAESIIEKYESDFGKEGRKEFFNEKNFILTEESKKRLALLIHYILNGIPVLLEGNTGTAKTRTIIIACEYINKFIRKNKNKLIRYNLSAETKIDDIISKYVSCKESLVGLKVKYGDFIDAYVNGNMILFDELNLASPNILQCIQQSLDNGFISVETNSCGLYKKNKNENFALVATQNPNKGAFAGKRQELGPEFLSRFQKINLPEISKEEMEKIAKGIAHNSNVYHKNLLKDIVNFHFECVKETNSLDDTQIFTIREIESVIECLSNGEDPYDSIMTIYGGRFRKEGKQKIKDILEKYNYITKNINKDNFPENFPECFINDALIQTVKNVLLALRNERNVIIVGDDESGLTQIAEWCSQYFNAGIEKKEAYTCFCTKNLECSDLIGTQKIVDPSENEGEPLKFQPNFLYKAIKEGFCVVLDSINEAPSRVIERLNGLLDKKNSNEEKKFEVPEDSNEGEIKIDNKFRIICTSNIKTISQVSPAFVNRFEVIVLEDQINDLTESQLDKLITFLCKKYQKECYDRQKNKPEINPGNKKNLVKYYNLNENIDIEENIEVTKEMLNLIVEKLKSLEPKKENELDVSASENFKKYRTMSTVSKFCRTIIIFKNKFRGKENISLESIINFSFEILFSEELSDNNSEIQAILKDEINNANKGLDLGEEQYYFKDSESLQKFMVQIYSCSLVNQHICIVGPPGIGKTIGARRLSLIREKILNIKYKSPFYMHTFHQFTRPNDYFGIFSLQDEKLVFREGTLTKSINEGNVFIGDEFNISSEDCMKAVAPVLELKFNESILIPGIDGEIKIDPDFFFIICQNDRNTFGRKDLPEKIKTKMKLINYPKRIQEEIENICAEMYENLIDQNNKEGINEAKKCGTFMCKLNENETLPQWSLRDISKLFARIKKQSKNSQDYQGLGIKENIFFYFLSSLNDKVIEDKAKEVTKIIESSFQLPEGEGMQLFKLYKSIPILSIEKNENIYEIYIIKDKIKIKVPFIINDEKIYRILNKLNSILDALFKILLASDDEPILISGPSSFKTYLAKFLFIDKKCEVISLNSELTISQLIGSTTLLTTEKAKNFYLKEIFEIIQANNIDNLLLGLEDFEKNKENIKKNIKELTEQFLKKKLNKLNSSDENNEIKELVNNLVENYEKNKENIENIMKKLTRESRVDEKFPFFHALCYFINKLFEEKKQKSLFDMVIEFNPGIFTSAIIRECNLILKNITSVKTENLERLNEALTGNKKITLNEDTQNSFTEENNKEIIFNNFRIVGTCNEGEETSLSEAFLSRFTLIYVNNYTEDEETEVLKSIVDDEEDITTINNILVDYYKNFPDIIKMNLSQKINSINMTKELDRIMEKSHQENLKFVLYFLLKGLNEKREVNMEKIKNIFGIDKYYNNSNESPIEIIANKINSKLYDLTMDIKRQLNNEEKLIIPFFTLKIKEILDVIHFSLSLKIPLILEGSYGQGKMSAIQYYAKMAHLEIVHVSISKGTKVDDLLCKTIIKTDKIDEKGEKGNFILINSKTPLCQAIECLENIPTKLVVLEGINNATPAVLEILNLIHGKKGTKIILPNGTEITKGNMYLISIFNPNDDFTREKLPGNIINSSLYHIAEDPSEVDIKNIISFLFEEAGLGKDEQEKFFSDFKMAQKISKEAEGEFPITLYEVRKYISFRKNIPNLDKNVFSHFIFENHFNQEENKAKVEKVLNLNEYLFNPIIEYGKDEKEEKEKLIFKSQRESDKNMVIYEIKKHIDDKEKKELKEKFDRLTLKEKFCFLFLICCVKARITPIIQGETASGKSFIVKLFSEILGQEINIYQLNSNSGISLFTGQSIMKEELDEKEKKKLKNILELLGENKEIENINSGDFSGYLQKIEKILNSNELTEEKKKEYENARDKLNKMKSPINRFEHKNSELIESMKYGKWVALDGIEMANAQISEKISSLCDEDPTLEVFESGREELNNPKIDNDFRLFIIYNPLSQGAKRIDKSLFNKCAKFTLPSIDSIPREATTMLYGRIMHKIDDEYKKNIPLWSNLSKRIVRYHIEQRKKTKENTDLIAGNVPFTSRNLCFISDDFHKYFKGKEKKNETSWLKGIFDNYYWRSFINYSDEEKENFIEETFKIIKTVPDQQYKIDIKIKVFDDFKDINEYLIRIQQYAIRDNEYRDFVFAKLLDNCLNKITLNKEKLNYINNNLYDTILLLDNADNIDIALKNKFYQINFIKDNFERILDNFENVNNLKGEILLNNDELLDNEEIKSYLLKMRFLNFILKKEDYEKIYNSHINYELFTPQTDELSKILMDLLKYKQKSNFDELIIFLFNNPEAFKIIHYYYPYNNEELKEGELKYANYYIYFFYNLYKEKYNFSIQIKNQSYEIKFSEEPHNKKLKPHLVFNEKNSLCLSENSYIKGAKYFYLILTPEEKTNFMFYNLDDALFNDPLEKTFNKIDDFQFETDNFFTDNKTPLISRVVSLIINLSDKYPNFIKYLKESFCFLEKDAIEAFESLYNNLNVKKFENMIDVIPKLTFFCESNNESMLWKYRKLLNLSISKNNNIEDKYNYFFKTKKINPEVELKSSKNEIDYLDKLEQYWENKVDKEDNKLIIINNYKNYLNKLSTIIKSYKGYESPEVIKLKKKADSLMEKLNNDKETQNQTLNSLKKEISEFLLSEKPTEDLYNSLESRVNKYFDLIKKQKRKKNFDALNLPYKEIKLYNDNIPLLKIYKLLFWYSFVENNLNLLFDINTNEDTCFNISFILGRDSELESINTRIEEKKHELIGKGEGNKNFDVSFKKEIMQMLRGIFLLKMKSEKIDLDKFSKFVENINSKINYIEEIPPEEEYYFSYEISNEYPKNMKIRMPIFESFDAFYLFFKYDKYDKYKKDKSYKESSLFRGIKKLFGGIDYITGKIFEKKKKKKR